MKILTHPKELTRENLGKWRKEFVKKIGRTTTRTDLDRLILAIERREFKNKIADWTEVIFEDVTGKVTDEYRSEEFEISEFEGKILDRNQNLKNKEIKKSALKEENGEWTLDGSLEEISRGGEAVVFKETISGLQVAVRVACFDSALFTGDMEDCSFQWHLSKGYLISSFSSNPWGSGQNSRFVRKVGNLVLKVLIFSKKNCPKNIDINSQNEALNMLVQNKGHLAI